MRLGLRWLRTGEDSREREMKSPMVVAVVVVVQVRVAIESPEYTVVHSESDSTKTRRGCLLLLLMTSPSKKPPEMASTDFQYIQGANLNSSRVAMTAPVLISIVPGAGPLHSSAYFVRFYLPAEFQASPPTPLPELNLRPYTWDSHYIAVWRFSGFARDGNIVKEAQRLSASLRRSPWGNSTSAAAVSGYAYSIAQYNSPFWFIGRVNEVWVDVDAYESSQIATY